MRAGQGLKLTTSRRPGDVINCHREDFYSFSGRLRDEENFAGTDFIFLFKFSTLSANQNVFAAGGKDLFNGKRTGLRSIGWRARVCVVQISETAGVKSPIRQAFLVHWRRREYTSLECVKMFYSLYMLYMMCSRSWAVCEASGL